MTFSLGIIGAGAIGAVHAAAASRSDVRVAAICDRTFETAERLADEHDGAWATTDVDGLLGSDVDAVAIAVPNALHRELALRAIAAGKHVLLEKPMALDAAECDEIVAAATASDRIVQVGFVCRGFPTSRTAKHFIDAGRLGSIYHVKCSVHRRRGIPGLGGWFTTKALSGGGPLIDLGVHVIDLSLYLAGSPRVRRVSGSAVSKFGSPIADYRFTEMWAGPPRLDGVFDVEDGAVALLRCEGGLTIEVNVTWASNIPDGVHPSGITVMGDRGGCFFEIFGREVSIATEEEGMIVDLRPHLAVDDPERDAWDEQYRVFAEAIESGRQPHADVHAGRAVQAVIDAIYRSSAEDREVEVAPAPQA